MRYSRALPGEEGKSVSMVPDCCSVSEDWSRTYIDPVEEGQNVQRHDDRENMQVELAQHPGLFLFGHIE